MSNASFYKWRATFDCVDASMIGQMKAIEDKNRRLKKMYAIHRQAAREVLGARSVGACPEDAPVAAVEVRQV